MNDDLKPGDLYLDDGNNLCMYLGQLNLVGFPSTRSPARWAGPGTFTLVLCSEHNSIDFGGIFRELCSKDDIRVLNININNIMKSLYTEYLCK